jgi:hypothetical protein
MSKHNWRACGRQQGQGWYLEHKFLIWLQKQGFRTSTRVYFGDYEIDIVGTRLSDGARILVEWLCWNPLAVLRFRIEAGSTAFVVSS